MSRGGVDKGEMSSENGISFTGVTGRLITPLG